MDFKKFGRREFLKLAAAAAAQGLSHFRFLNFSGLGVVSAEEEPDACLAAITGVCVNADACDPTGAQDICDPPGDPDVCQLPDDADTCRPEPPEDPDICEPLPGDPDVCQPLPGDPDACYPPSGDQDICMPAPGDPDQCNVPEDPDICDPAFQEPDECDPPVNSEDYCDPQYPAEPDMCLDPTGGYSTPDACNPPEDPDECAPIGAPEDICDPPRDPTDTSDVKISSLKAKSVGGRLMGFLAALVAGAALLGKRKFESEETE